MVCPLSDLYHLDDCVDWIINNSFKKVVIQMKHNDLKHSVAISKYIEDSCSERLSHSPKEGNDTERHLEIYVTRSNTCCIDLLSVQHVTNLDALIHIGQVCLTKPEIKKPKLLLPALFIFPDFSKSDDAFMSKVDSIISQIESIKEENMSSFICLIYDTALMKYALALDERLKEKQYDSFVEVADLYCPDPSWSLTPDCRDKFTEHKDASSHVFGHYLLQKHISNYNCAIYIGQHLSIQLALNCPSKIIKMNWTNSLEVELVNTSRLLNRRIAIVSRLKEEEELKIGVIITNPLPDLPSMIQRLNSFSGPRKHILYFISMIQTIDDCKVGNFDLCDAFVVINSCFCSTILESLVFNRPILTEAEYKLACGFEAEYGRVSWPGTSSHLSEDDINRRKVSDVSLALIHTRNELLERCSQARANKWSGLEYKAPDGDIDWSGQESLVVEEGLKGIASSYMSEPKMENDSADVHKVDDSCKGKAGEGGEVSGEYEASSGGFVEFSKTTTRYHQVGGSGGINDNKG